MENCSTSLKQSRKKYKSNFLEKLFSILQVRESLQMPL